MGLYLRASWSMRNAFSLHAHASSVRFRCVLTDATCTHCDRPASDHIKARPRLLLCPKGPLQTFEAKDSPGYRGRYRRGRPFDGGSAVTRALAETRARLASRMRP